MTEISPALAKVADRLCRLYDRPFGGTDPPMVAYRFEDGRGGDHPARHLAGFTGILQVDGYTAYRRLADPARSEAPMTLAACWAHLRRKFYELKVTFPLPSGPRRPRPTSPPPSWNSLTKNCGLLWTMSTANPSS